MLLGHSRHRLAHFVIRSLRMHVYARSGQGITSSLFTFRLFGMTGVIRTNISDPHTLGLHPHVSWPDFISPLVLLLLYYTLVALLHKWVHITEEVCVFWGELCSEAEVC